MCLSAPALPKGGWISVSSAKVSCVVNKPDMLADLVNTSVCHPELHDPNNAVVYACQRQVILSPKS